MAMFPQKKIDKTYNFCYNVYMKYPKTVATFIAFTIAFFAVVLGQNTQKQTLTIASSLEDSETEVYHRVKLLNAICEVESGCDSTAVGDDKKAIGAYQIWKVYWIDAIEHDPSIGGEYEDCYNKEYAEKIIFSYWDRYATKKRLGHEPIDEDLARIHNGGPNGYKKDATLKYWNKIKKELNY